MGFLDRLLGRDRERQEQTYDPSMTTTPASPAPGRAAPTAASEAGGIDVGGETSADPGGYDVGGETSSGDSGGAATRAAGATRAAAETAAAGRD